MIAVFIEVAEETEAIEETEDQKALFKRVSK